MNADNLRAELQVLAEASAILHTADIAERIMERMPAIQAAVAERLLDSGDRNLWEIARRRGLSVDQLLDAEIAALVRSVAEDVAASMRGPS